jgi:hypothetical protein
LTMTYEHAHYNTFGIFGALPTVLSVGDVTWYELTGFSFDYKGYAQVAITQFSTNWFQRQLYRLTPYQLQHVRSILSAIIYYIIIRERL